MTLCPLNMGKSGWPERWSGACTPAQYLRAGLSRYIQQRVFVFALVGVGMGCVCLVCTVCELGMSSHYGASVTYSYRGLNMGPALCQATSQGVCQIAPGVVIDRRGLARQCRLVELNRFCMQHRESVPGAGKKFFIMPGSV